MLAACRLLLEACRLGLVACRFLFFLFFNFRLYRARIAAGPVFQAMTINLPPPHPVFQMNMLHDPWLLHPGTTSQDIWPASHEIRRTLG
jgi:hypothetical protein